ncbi:hypothetical protein BDP55DRAFT_563677 [Colletotrichum godetiae]|uniref:Uncharacterized protein n=1 Tax=Colletotrichum godetiae TaxID=1209918 RepID=A0AAJ0A9Q2_9PEZI|nr:uncharacterized protein BDP55DRAFT_563677 [Colletotrichum godetiae]KAK1659128.1 hypothetical protein BDP55DRAFT_563677 [Colletotrichum godetiae]
METKQEDHEPFLGFRDDPNKRISNEHEEMDNDSSRRRQQQALRTSRPGRLLRDVLVCLATSLLWVAAFYLLVPKSLNRHTGGNVTEGEGGGDRTPTSSDYIAAFHNVTTNAEFISCGNSTVEAKKMNCKYDTLLNYWVPSQCYDREFETEYKDDDSWNAFADQNLTQPIAAEAMGDQEVYYTSIRDHLNHCSMLWKKQFWTLFEERTVFDAIIVNSFHTEHCADFLKDIYGSNRTEATLVRVGFSGCWVRSNSKEV